VRTIPAEAATGQVRRVFGLGSEWTVFYLYSGAATADEVLRKICAPMVRRAMTEGLADGWFFIRYADPDPHLRFRLHGPVGRMPDLMREMERMSSAQGAEGLARAIKIDVYQRETQRYGGALGIALAEQIFGADSEAVLAIVETLVGDEGAEARWRLTLRGTDAMLDDLGLDLGQKLRVIQAVRQYFDRTHHATVELKRQIGDRFRKDRAALEALLDPAQDQGSELEPGFVALHHRSALVRPIVAELRALERAGRLSRSIEEQASSYIHMHSNRLLRAPSLAQELVIAHFLERLYEGQQARRRARTRPG